MKKAVIYARYSSDKQREESIEGQLKLCYEFAKRNDIDIVGEYIDRAQSGTRDKRKEFQKMISDSKNRLFDYIIIYKTDRFARNEHDAVVYEHYLLSNNVQILYATQPFLNSRGGRIIKAVFRVQDEEYSNILSERTKLGLAMNVEKGQVVSGHFPIGYQIIDKKLQINPETQEIPKIVFNLYIKGYTSREINKELDRLGYRTFHINSIPNMIRNKKYIGTFAFDNKEYENYHPAIIDKKTFETANRVLERRSAQASRRPEEFLLSGIIYNHDGKRFIGSSANNKLGVKYCYYRLGKRYIKKDALEQDVINLTLESISTKTSEITNSIFDKIVKQKSNTKIIQITNQIQKIDREINNLLDAIKAGITNASVKDEFDRLEKLKDTLTIDLTRSKQYEMSKDEINQEIKNIKKRHLDENDKASIINTLVDKIVIYGDYAAVWFKVAGQTISIEEINVRLEQVIGALDVIETNTIQAYVDVSKHIYLYSVFSIRY